MHRSGAVFVRVAPGGLVLLPNVHWRDSEEVCTDMGGRRCRRRTGVEKALRKQAENANEKGMSVSHHLCRLYGCTVKFLCR